MSGERRKYVSPRDWEAVYAAMGREAAGKPPPGARLGPSDVYTRWHAQMPQPPMMFGSAPERPEQHEARQQQQRVRRLLKKHGIGPPGKLWERI